MSASSGTGILVFDDMVCSPLVTSAAHRSPMTSLRSSHPQSPREFQDDVDMRILESKLELMAIQRDHMRRNLENNLLQTEGSSSHWSLPHQQRTHQHEKVLSPRDLVDDVDMRALQGKLDLLAAQRELSSLKRAAFAAEVREVRSHQSSPRHKLLSPLDSLAEATRGKRSFSLQRGENPFAAEGTGLLRSKTGSSLRDTLLRKTSSGDFRGTPLLSKSPLGSPRGTTSKASGRHGQRHKRSNLGSHGASLRGSPVSQFSPPCLQEEGVLVRRKTVGTFGDMPRASPLGSPMRASSPCIVDEGVLSRRKTLASSARGCVDFECPQLGEFSFSMD